MKIERDPDPAHRRIWDAIPWVVNGTATEAAQREVEAHLGQCENCREEFDRQSRLHGAIQADAWVDTGAEAGLAMLQARIGKARTEVPAQPAARRGLFARFGPRSILVGALATAVVIEGVGIVTLGFGLVTRDEPAARYRTLSEAQPTETPRGEIRVVLSPELRIGELAQLLEGLQLEVVAGPNEAGAYTLAPRPAARSREDRLARLRSTAGVQMAEPVAGTEADR